jgi:hypothetical protein
MTEQHTAQEIVVHRDHDDWKRVGLVDDYGQKIELSLAQLYLSLPKTSFSLVKRRAGIRG